MSGSRIPTLGPNGEGWVAGQVLLLLGVAVSGAMALGHFSLDSPLRDGGLVAGLVLILAGALLFGRGLRDLGASLAAVPRPKPDAGLVETGIYRRIRHPIYAGMVFSALGWALFSWSGIAMLLAIALAVVLDLKARLEERWLVARHPTYASYRLRSNRFLPGIY
ncbi:MAG: isoprenylcysteine carboxylmethyltransferase family protein [Chloroflexi bacterium]|nr:MAG: isoprenylcysteine carboxylmethyltransferase family protein [Chloroflexota bacterium]